MATVTTVDGQPVDRTVQIEALVAGGMSREYAEFVVAMEAGEVDGDVITLEGEESDENRS